jgi:hypothetical protein
MSALGCQLRPAVSFSDETVDPQVGDPSASAGDVCRREEPPRHESGLRAHGSNQRFHRLLGHAVARAPTTAPRLTGLGPTAPRILTLQGWRRKGPPRTLSRKPRQLAFRCVEVTTARSRRRSIESNEGIDCCETALREVGPDLPGRAIVTG